MKKKLLLLLFCVSSIAMFAQEEEQEQEEEKERKNILDRRHEVRIDAAEGLADEVIEISYEYVISRFSSVGLSVLKGFKENDRDRYTSFQITPFYRQYFFNKKEYGARGFYAEGVLNYAAGKDPVTNFIDDEIVDSTVNDWSRFGIGFAIGQKWVSQNGFIIDLSLGGGRNFGNEDNITAFFRGGAAIGYRF